MAAMGRMGEMGRRALLRTFAGQLRLVLVPSHAADRHSEGWTHFCGLGGSGDDHQRDHSRHGDEYVAAPGAHHTWKYPLYSTVLFGSTR